MHGLRIRMRQATSLGDGELLRPARPEERAVMEAPWRSIVRGAAALVAVIAIACGGSGPRAPEATPPSAAGPQPSARPPSAFAHRARAPDAPVCPPDVRSVVVHAPSLELACPDGQLSCTARIPVSVTNCTAAPVALRRVVVRVAAQDVLLLEPD